MKTHSRYNAARKALIFWCLFIGIGAVAGSTAMLLKPDGSLMGMQPLLPYFQVLPFAKYLFQNYIFSGIALLIVNGISNLTAAVLMLKKRKSGIICGGIFGVTLVAWICIQFVIFPANFMSTSYFIFGLIQALTGYAAWVFYEQENFSALQEDYPNIGTNPKELVVYFSRMGYTKKAACEAAEKSGAEIYEVKSSEHTEGTSGFWWCGRFALHRWAMPLEEVKIDFSKYDKVTICSPIWAFHLSAPMRSFCTLASGKIKRADYILLHHQKSNYENAVREMDRLLKINHEKATTICCREGHKLFSRVLTEPKAA